MHSYFPPASLDCSREDFLSLASAILNRGAVLEFQAKGFSMYPQIMEGDVLCIKKTPLYEFKRGNIILYEDNEGAVVVHRLVQIINIDGNTNFITKGDALSKQDAVFSSKRVLGKLIAVKRNGHNIKMDGMLIDIINFIRVSPAFISVKKYVRKALG